MMRLARQGDDEAYRRLLRHVLIWLRSVVRRGLTSAGRGTADSEDIVQEALLAMHLKRDTWDETQPLDPWLRAIARHKLVDHLRRRGFHDHFDIDEFGDRGNENLGEFLLFLPGVSVTTSGSEPTTVAMRGFPGNNTGQAPGFFICAHKAFSDSAQPARAIG